MSYVPEHFFRQSAVIPFRRRDDGVEVMVITSRSNKRWVIPKGVIELGMTPVESVIKEAKEEAGLEGEVPPEPIGLYRYAKWEGTCTVEVFVMEVERVWSQWQESYRRREWVSLEEAAGRMKEPHLKEMILGLPRFLEGRDRPA